MRETNKHLCKHTVTWDCSASVVLWLFNVWRHVVVLVWEIKILKLVSRGKFWKNRIIVWSAWDVWFSEYTIERIKCCLHGDPHTDTPLCAGEKLPAAYNCPSVINACCSGETVVHSARGKVLEEEYNYGVCINYILLKVVSCVCLQKNQSSLEWLNMTNFLKCKKNDLGKRWMFW